MKTAGLSGDPIATAWQLKTRTPANIIEDVFNKDADQAQAYLQQYRFEQHGLYNVMEFALHIEQHNALPDWAERFKLPLNAPSPPGRVLPEPAQPSDRTAGGKSPPPLQLLGDVIERFKTDSEEVATFYNHNYLSQEQSLKLENYLSKLDPKEIKTLWEHSLYHPGYALLQVLVRTGTMEKVIDRSIAKSALQEVIKEGDTNLLRLLLQIKKFNPNVILEDGRYLIHWAVANQHQGIFDLLLQDARVNFMIRDLNRDTPYQIAERNGLRNLQDQLMDRIESVLDAI